MAHETGIWRSIWALPAAAFLFCQAAGAANIVLVRGSSSTPNEAERNYAEALTRNMSRWLSEIGATHDLIDDERVGSAALAQAKVVILGYNPFPTKKELWALKTFVGKGGKLIVFYSAEPALAELMNVKLGKQLSAPRDGKWSAMRFNGDAPPHVPATVSQESRVIRPPLPIEGKSRTIAFWEDSAGKRTDDAAWAQSDRGFWMSHVLLDDADIEGKKLMLLGLIGALDPSVWKPAAARYLETSSRLNGFRSFQDAFSSISAQAKAAGRETRVNAALADASALCQELIRLSETGKSPDVVEKSGTLRALLLDAHASAQRPKPGEFRAVWDHSGVGLYPGDWNRTCKVLAANGFTDVMSNMLGGGLAHYDSKPLRESEMFKLYGDQLAQFVAAAHENGLRAHAWKVCWKMDSAPEDILKAMRESGRLQVSDAGATLNWLCPSNPDNRGMELDSLKEIAAGYAVDGIHLDYIRFKDAHFCFCPACRKAFEKDLGRAVKDWPQDAKKGDLRNEYFRWRREQITGFVREAAVECRKLKPGIKISAAVYGKYQTCGDSVGQDWGLWLKEGFADFVCPMNYTNDLERFASYVRAQTALPASKGRVFPGIGVTATESRLDPAQTIDQIAALRKEGADGFVLFDLSRELEREFLPRLRQGVMAEE